MVSHGARAQYPGGWWMGLSSVVISCWLLQWGQRIAGVGAVVAASSARIALVATASLWPCAFRLAAQGHGFGLRAVGVVFVVKANMLSIDGLDTRLVDGDAVNVACEVEQDAAGCLLRGAGVYDPLLRQLPGRQVLPEPLKRGKALGPEDGAERAYGQAVAFGGGLPVALTGQCRFCPRYGARQYSRA